MHWLLNPDNSTSVAAISLFLTMLGFALTAWGIRLTYVQAQKAVSAAEAANLAVGNFKFRVRQQGAARDVGEALYAVEATRRHLANDAWKDAAETYEDARRALIRLHADTSYVREEFRDRFQIMLTHMLSFCEAVDEANAGKGKLPNKVKVLSTIRENYQVLVSIRSELE